MASGRSLIRFLASQRVRNRIGGRAGCDMYGHARSERIQPGQIGDTNALWRGRRLHPEDFGNRGGAVKMANEPMLQAIAGRRELKSKPVYLLVREVREIPGESRILLKHSDTRH